MTIIMRVRPDPEHYDECLGVLIHHSDDSDEAVWLTPDEARRAPCMDEQVQAALDKMADFAERGLRRQITIGPDGSDTFLVVIEEEQ